MWPTLIIYIPYLIEVYMSMDLKLVTVKQVEEEEEEEEEEGKENVESNPTRSAIDCFYWISEPYGANCRRNGGPTFMATTWYY
jgi:hypothetical protein